MVYSLEDVHELICYKNTTLSYEEFIVTRDCYRYVYL